MNRREKERVVSELHERLQDFTCIIFTDYRGLNVEEITRLRRQLREASVEYRVVKNTLMRLATKETSLEGLSELLAGPTAMAISNDDPLAPARLLTEFSKETPKLEIKGGLVEGRVVGPGEIEGLAKLPGKEVLLGNLLRLFKGGQFRLVSVLSAHLMRLMRVLGAIRTARQGAEEAKEEVKAKEGAEEQAQVEDEEKVKVEAEVEEVVKEEEEKEKAQAEVEDVEKVKVEAEVEEVVKEEEKEKARAEVKEEAKEEVTKEPKKEEE